MELYKYYNHTIRENEEGRGWSQYYYGVFSKIINENNYKNVAEVGIGYGTHAKYILKTTNIDHILLVDPMQYYPNDGFATDIMNQIPHIPGNNFNEMFELINLYLSDYKDKYTWQRCPSLNAKVEDQSLDCVFVDGDHSYNAVLNDLRFWHKKVRVGGKLLGDDYWMEDVKRAVHDFEKESGMKAQFINKENKNYAIYCFDL
jgi:hypothetical protein